MFWNTLSLGSDLIMEAASNNHNKYGLSDLPSSRHFTHHYYFTENFVPLNRPNDEI